MPPTILADSTAPAGFELLPVIALIAATAAYVGAIRLWFHKLRMDVIDALRKAKGERSLKPAETAKEVYQPDYLERRLRGAVYWLRLLSIIDFVVLAGVVALLKAAFGRFLPWNNWDCDRPTSGLAVGMNFVWLIVALVCIAHIWAGLRAWMISPRYEPDRPRRTVRGGFMRFIRMLASLEDPPANSTPPAAGESPRS